MPENQNRKTADQISDSQPSSDASHQTQNQPNESQQPSGNASAAVAPPHSNDLINQDDERTGEGTGAKAGEYS